MKKLLSLMILTILLNLCLTTKIDVNELNNEIDMSGNDKNGKEIVKDDENGNNSKNDDYDFKEDAYYGPQSPVVPCSFLPMDFIECDELIDHRKDEKSFKDSGLGCLKFGGQSVKGEF